MKKCATCNNGTVKRGTAILERSVAGTRFKTEVRALVCNSCGEQYVDADFIDRFELQIALELACMGNLSPESFRFMRKAIGLSAVELARLLGVKTETVSRWENGKRELDRGAFALLGGLVSERVTGNTTTISCLLEALKKPIHLRTKQLKVA